MDRPLVELGQGIASIKVEPFRPFHLKVGQHGDGLVQQLLLIVAEYPGEPTPFDAVKQDGVAQVLLDIKHLVVGDCKYFRDMEPFLVKVACQVNKRPVLVTRFTVNANQRLTISGEPVIPSVGTGRRQCLHGGGCFPGVRGKKGYKLLHEMKCHELFFEASKKAFSLSISALSSASEGRYNLYFDANNCLLSFKTEYFAMVESVSVQSRMPIVGLSDSSRRRSSNIFTYISICPIS